MLRKTVIFVVCMLSFLILNFCFAEEKSLQLSIKTDKTVYEQGDDIKITYMIKNINKEPVKLLYNDDCFDNNLTYVGDKQFGVVGGLQTAEQIPEWKVINGNEIWQKEKLVVKLSQGPVYKYRSDKGNIPVDKLIYEGPFIIFPETGIYLFPKETKNISGHYLVKVKFCDYKDWKGIWDEVGRVSDRWQGCLEDSVEITIK